MTVANWVSAVGEIEQLLNKNMMLLRLTATLFDRVTQARSTIANRIYLGLALCPVWIGLYHGGDLMRQSLVAANFISMTDFDESGQQGLWAMRSTPVGKRIKCNFCCKNEQGVYRKKEVMVVFSINLFLTDNPGT